MNLRMIRTRQDTHVHMSLVYLCGKWKAVKTVTFMGPGEMEVIEGN